MNPKRCIHLIENQHRFKKIGDDIYESGYWKVKEIKAAKLRGGSIFFHEKHDEPSFFGGTIINYRIATKKETDEYNGRVIFIFRSARDHKDFRTDKHGWGNEKKIILK